MFMVKEYLANLNPINQTYHPVIVLDEVMTTQFIPRPTLGTNRIFKAYGLVRNRYSGVSYYRQLT